MTGMGQFIDANTLRFERIVPGPIERVWSYLVQPERLATWLADSDVEPQPGGRIELRFDVNEAPERRNGGAAIAGFITLWNPPRALGYSWVDKNVGEPNPSNASHVAFDLEARDDDQLLLVLTHERLPTDVLATCAAGWHAHLEILEARLRWQTPVPFLSVFEPMRGRYEQLLRERKAG